MPSEYIPLFVFAIVVAAVPAVGFGLARRAGRNAAEAEEQSGAASESLALEETERRSNTFQTYLAGALFLLCDAAIVFLILWAVRMGDLGAFGIAAIAGFLGVLACGYIWLYRHRALERL
jgi:NADH:ubiquinone oxidoreductase subunit 3 (subunit A)